MPHFDRSSHRSAAPGAGVPARRIFRLVWLAPALLVTGCASTAPHYPAQTAQRFIGKPLFALEMHWSIPIARRHGHTRGSRLAIWKFNQYNFDGCSVTVHLDRRGIIRAITWTRGCGPKKAIPRAQHSAAPAH